MQVQFGAITVASGKPEKIYARLGESIPRMSEDGIVVAGQKAWWNSDSHEITSIFHNTRNDKLDVIQLKGPDVTAFLKDKYAFDPEVIAAFLEDQDGMTENRGDHSIRIMTYLRKWVFQLGSLFKISRPSDPGFVHHIPRAFQALPAGTIDMLDQAFEEKEGKPLNNESLYESLKAYVTGLKTDAEGNPIKRIKG